MRKEEAEAKNNITMLKNNARKFFRALLFNCDF